MKGNTTKVLPFIAMGAAVRLSEFITQYLNKITEEWESFTVQLVPQSKGLSPEALRDHHTMILGAIAKELDIPESKQEQINRSRGGGTHYLRDCGRVHAIQRLEVGFSIVHLVAEYRALRSTVVRLWCEKFGGTMNAAVSSYQITRFNEAIDEVLTESINEYNEATNRHRNELIGILGHDLRNPLSAIIMGAGSLAGEATLDDRQARIANRILNSAKRMNRMVSYLLDLLRIKQGNQLPVSPKPMNLEELCQQVIGELLMINPHRAIHFSHEGDLHGTWDEDRLAQVLSNLIGNALQHGTGDVDVIARQTDGDLIIMITNHGPVIPPAHLSGIFEPMVSLEEGGSGLGLGLHIARKIIEAHNGTISVTSTQKRGTTFTILIPRHTTPSQRPLK